MPNFPFITIGILSYKDQKYLTQNLSELKKLDYPEYEIVICDNNPDDTILEWLKKEHPDIKVIRPGGNIGFGRGHNLLIDQCKGDFYLGFNSDMLPEPGFLKELMTTMQKDDKTGIVTGKLLQWRTFPTKPTLNEKHYIDTAGLLIHKNHQVIDRGQTEEDMGQYDQEEEIWGASGAAPLFRIKALKDIAHSEGEYFDKDFFLYKEDVDLAYRMHWAGWKAVYNPRAVAWHDRTTSKPESIFSMVGERKNRSKIVKEQSFANQMILTFKNWSNEYSWTTKLKTAFFLFKYTMYALLVEPYLLKQFKTYSKMKPVMTEKRKKMPRRITAQEMEKWFI